MVQQLQRQFQPGDVIQLKSGGPKMTVYLVMPNGVSCQWFAGGKLRVGHFNLEIVARVEEEEKKQ
jgi:uncharacterized protein YodC (DUF2158 family)